MPTESSGSAVGVEEQRHHLDGGTREAEPTDHLFGQRRVVGDQGGQPDDERNERHEHLCCDRERPIEELQGHEAASERKEHARVPVALVSGRLKPGDEALDHARSIGTPGRCLPRDAPGRLGCEGAVLSRDGDRDRVRHRRAGRPARQPGADVVTDRQRLRRQANRGHHTPDGTTRRRTRSATRAVSRWRARLPTPASSPTTTWAWPTSS